VTYDQNDIWAIYRKSSEQNKYDAKESCGKCNDRAQYLNDIERDRRNPSSDQLVQQFANVLSLDADYLHYLNGRFPEQERKQQLTEQQFKKRILAFREGAT
jgi:transcriptional regulator with XRE-family HTH domain